MNQIYISHIPEDRESVARLYNHLTRAGYEPFVHHSISSGEDWNYEIPDEICNSLAMVVFLSPKSANSIHVTYEWALALGAGIPVIPVVHRGVQSHPHLSILEQVDFGSHQNEDLFWEVFIRDLQRILGSSTAPQQQQETQQEWTYPEEEEDVEEEYRPREEQIIPQVMEATIARKPQDERLTQESSLVEFDDFEDDDQILPEKAGLYLIVKVRNKAPTTYRLDSDSISLGRDPNSDICINDTSVSRAHLRFVRTSTGYQVIDLGSTNGTYTIHGEKISMVKLRVGDVLLIGDTISMSYESVP